jgi:hypothetical protein
VKGFVVKRSSFIRTASYNQKRSAFNWLGRVVEPVALHISLQYS